MPGCPREYELAPVENAGIISIGRPVHDLARAARRPPEMFEPSCLQHFTSRRSWTPRGNLSNSGSGFPQWALISPLTRLLLIRKSGKNTKTKSPEGTLASLLIFSHLASNIRCHLFFFFSEITKINSRLYKLWLKSLSTFLFPYATHFYAFCTH